LLGGQVSGALVLLGLAQLASKVKAFADGGELASAQTASNFRRAVILKNVRAVSANILPFDYFAAVEAPR
jgi:hypothetical protein